MSSNIDISREVAERFIKAMDSLTDCMAASYALHVEIKAALAPEIKRPEKPAMMPMARDCGCYRDGWGKFVMCFQCYERRND